MSSSPAKKGKPNAGVRGPGGPQAARPASAPRTSSGASPLRQRFERLSFPALRVLSGLPKWLVVVLPAVLLLLGLIQTGSLAWLGGVLLTIVFLILAWLTALSWPVITPGSRFMRVIVLVALLGITVLKFAGRF